MMDVTFVLEESGVTATVEVPCEADVAAAKEVACTALAVSPASVEMRIGTQVLEGTCRLQDTAFDAGVQVVLACPRFADIKCPAECSTRVYVNYLLLSRCGTLCVFSNLTGHVGGFDTETFDTVFAFAEGSDVVFYPFALSQCKTRCYVPCEDYLLELALPGGEVVRKVDGTSRAVSACGSVVVSFCEDGVSVYDEDLTLLRSLSHKGCDQGYGNLAVSHCGGWVVTGSFSENNARLWDVNTGVVLACVPAEGRSKVALSRSASVFAVGGNMDDPKSVQLYDWSGTALQNASISGDVCGVQFTQCGKYLVVNVHADEGEVHEKLHQYEVATMTCVLVIPDVNGRSFAISPCSRAVVFVSSKSDFVPNEQGYCSSPISKPGSTFSLYMVHGGKIRPPQKKKLFAVCITTANEVRSGFGAAGIAPSVAIVGLMGLETVLVAPSVCANSTFHCGRADNLSPRAQDWMSESGDADYTHLVPKTWYADAASNAHASFVNISLSVLLTDER